MKYRMVSLGCPKNLVDSEHMAGRLEKAGHELSDEADVVIVNTCAFIADACSESIETILEEAKNAHAKGKRLVVTGCLVERYGAELERLLPEVDAFVARDSYGSIEELLNEKGFHRARGPGAGAIESSPRRVLTRPPTAYLKIQEGCNNRCSYCTIPTIRGPLVSRDPSDVVDELKTLLREGYKEINLIGQDITSFGRDKGFDIKGLLKRLLAIKEDFFLRLLYLHPLGIDDALLDLMAADERIVKYLDIPIQHSEDLLLKSMNRGYSKKGLDDLFGKIRERMDDVVLRTTVMVGYPGETEEDFASLCDFVAKWEFDNLGAFTYSREKGTPAARIKGHPTKGVKKKRYQRIMEMQKEISKRRLGRLKGREMPVIVEASEADGFTGRTILQAPDVDGIAFIRGKCEVGQIRKGRVVDTLDYDVIIEVGG
ncbi:MAG TPA: 30S ribosomal protein S12 methylthiotransferase RimO [Syntrophorhabdales bacterium]|nr:30S ribosomal protein S12 methylthiotransferase RimO [Syntrophorhabdales bacterium]